MRTENGPKSPAASFVMPVYNGARHLAEALDSLLTQTEPDFEIVAVDDGSTDDSWAILGEYASSDSRVRPVRLPENRGHCTASNEAMRHARAKVLLRHDQDDLAVPERVERTLDAFASDERVGFVNASYIRWLPEGSRKTRHPPTGDGPLRLALHFTNYICHSTAAFHRDRVDTLELEYREVGGPQDYDLWIRLMASTRMLTIREPLAIYRQEEMAMTAMYADTMDQSVGSISARLLDPIVGKEMTPRVRSLYGLSEGAPTDRSTVAALLHVFDPTAHPDIAAHELAASRASWVRRAVRASLSSQNPFPRRPSLSWTLLRREPRTVLTALRPG